jgi:hypothetical protein
MKFKQAKALFGKNAEAYLKFSMNDAETIKAKYNALIGEAITPVFKTGETYTVTIQYGDPFKMGGYEKEFTGTPEQIKVEADRLKESMWRSMNCLGEPYCGIRHKGSLYNKNLMVREDKTWTLAEYYSAIEKGLIRPVERKTRAKLLSFLHLPDFLTIEEADNSLIYEERFGYFRRAPGQVVLPEGCVA